MTDLIDSANATSEAIAERYADKEFRMACRTGALEALVLRLAIEIDVYADDNVKERVEKIFLDYQTR
jgi:hypothetical protein